MADSDYVYYPETKQQYVPAPSVASMPAQVERGVIEENKLDTGRQEQADVGMEKGIKGAAERMGRLMTPRNGSQDTLPRYEV